MKVLPARADFLRRWRWLRFVAIVGVLAFATHRTIDWAMLPGFWSGNMFGDGDTALATAQHHFGPILLVKHWLTDPEGMWGTQTEVLTVWGYRESAARLRLIIWALCAVVCTLVIIMVRKRTQQSTGE